METKELAAGFYSLSLLNLHFAHFQLHSHLRLVVAFQQEELSILFPSVQLVVLFQDQGLADGWNGESPLMVSLSQIAHGQMGLHTGRLSRRRLLPSSIYARKGEAKYSQHNEQKEKTPTRLNKLRGGNEIEA